MLVGSSCSRKSLKELATEERTCGLSPVSRDPRINLVNLGVGRERSYVLEGCGVRKKRASKVLSSKNSKAVAEDEMKAEYSFRISYEANRMKPHWCMEVSGIAFLPFLSCIETVKLFTENYPEIRQIRREGGRFIFETSIAANENLGTPENLRTRLQQFCVNARK
ncbi:unnamed protein product, partial [Allacma fusca]